jgi:hypothetical protein
MRKGGVTRRRFGEGKLLLLPLKDYLLLRLINYQDFFGKFMPKQRGLRGRADALVVCFTYLVRCERYEFRAERSYHYYR